MLAPTASPFEPQDSHTILENVEQYHRELKLLLDKLRQNFEFRLNHINIVSKSE